MAALGQLRQMLRYFDAGRAGGDRSECAADAFGRLGLEVEAFVLREPAREEDINHRASAPRGGVVASLYRGRGTQRRQMVHPQAQKADRARLDGGATRDARMLESCGGRASWSTPGGASGWD